MMAPSCLGDDLAGNFGFAAVPPHIPPTRDAAHMIFEDIAGNDRFAEFGLVDGHEVDQPWLRDARMALDGQYAPGLRHPLEYEHAGHDGIVWKMPHEMGLVDCHILDA